MSIIIGVGLLLYHSCTGVQTLRTVVMLTVPTFFYLTLNLGDGERENLFFMNNKIIKGFLFAALMFTMTSCYTFTATVGNGPQTGQTIVKHNHYLIDGLAPLSTASLKDELTGVENYEITIKHSFVDGLLKVITGYLYTPTTVIIKK